MTKIRIVIVIGTIATSLAPRPCGWIPGHYVAVCVVVLAVEAHSELLDPVCAPHVLVMCVSCVSSVHYPLQTKILIVIVCAPVNCSELPTINVFKSRCQVSTVSL